MHAHALGSRSSPSRPAESPESEVHRPQRRRAKRCDPAGAGAGPGRPSGRVRGGRKVSPAEPRVAPPSFGPRRAHARAAAQGRRGAPAGPAPGNCPPPHTHTRPVADKGILCFLQGREGVCESAATRLWRPRGLSAPQRPRSDGAAAGPRERRPPAPGTARARLVETLGVPAWEAARSVNKVPSSTRGPQINDPHYNQTHSD